MEMGFLAFSAGKHSEQLKLFTFDCLSWSNLKKRAFYSTFVASTRFLLYFSLHVLLLQSRSVLGKHL